MAPFESTDHGFLPQDLATTSDVTFGSLQIAEKVLFQYSGSSPHALAEIDAKKDGTNGGDLEFYTKFDAGSMTKKLTIASTGAIGIGAVPDYGTLDAGHVLTSRGSDYAPSWTTPLAPASTYAGASISKTISVTTETVLNTWSSQVAVGINVASTDAFTTPTDGWYSLGYSFECQGTSSNTFYAAILRIKRNGTTYQALQNHDTASELNYSVTFGGGILIQMTEGQYITFTAEVNATQYLVTGHASLVKVS